MNIKKVKAAYFTGTGTTEKIVTFISQEIARQLNIKLDILDFSLPSARIKPLVFTEEDLVIFGTFVVAGRVPNVLLPFFRTIQGNGGYSVPIVLYGNRSYDDALIELRDILSAGKLHTIAAAAFIGEHSFSESIANGRPDLQDIDTARKFANKIVQRISAQEERLDPVQISGTAFPYRDYYKPLNISGEPVRFLKAKPVTNDSCTDCKLCADICPMGSIDRVNVKNVTGLCIKCCACIKKCPANAKHFVNEDFLSHKAFLEKKHTARNEPELFL